MNDAFFVFAFTKKACADAIVRGYSLPRVDTVFTGITITCPGANPSSSVWFFQSK